MPASCPSILPPDSRGGFSMRVRPCAAAKVAQLVESLVNDLLNESRSEADKEALLEALTARKKELGNLLATAARQ